jgi:hypothetical protein
VFQLAAYQQYRETANNFEKYLQDIIPNLEINTRAKKFIVDGITITPEI